MTYLQFHLFFNVPLLFFLALAAAPFLLASQVIIAILIVLAIVMVFTTPWDNYAAFKGIWGFSEGQYTKKIGYLPIEEYLFFITQSLQAMMLTMIISSWLPEIETIATSFTLFSPGSLAIGLGISAIFILIGWKVGLPLAPFSKWQYTWHLFFWFGLVWSLQLWVGWSILLPRWPILLGVTLLLGTWLTIADIIAVKFNIWFFDQRQISGFKIGGILPWEEAAFFYSTSLIVAQSFLLFLPEALR